MELEYAVIGTGACGGVVGGKLFGAGRVVNFLARRDCSHIQSNGIEIQGQSLANIKSSQVSVQESITEMPKCDVILLTVKGYDNASILPNLGAVLKPESIIIIFQNGLGIEKELARLYPNIRQIVTVSWIKATRLSPGIYRHDFGTLVDAIAYLGSSDTYSSEPDSLEKQVIVDFAKAGLNLQFSRDFFNKQWTKLALNIPLFIITIKCNISSKTALSDNVHSTKIAALRGEIEQVARAYSIEIDTTFIAQVDQQLKDSESHTYPSMKVDFDSKKKLELETIFLPVIQMAGKKGVEILELVSEYEQVKVLAAENDSSRTLSLRVGP